MAGYQRPSIREAVFLDPSGGVVQYGRRWGSDEPPPDTYSVLSHPERFAPIHAVADALIDHLVGHYRVAMVDDGSVATDLMRVPPGILRSVRLTPQRSDAASLTVVYTDFPGLVVHAGLLHDFPYPQCGCDACDETWHSAADEFETQAFAVVRGDYTESVEGRLRPWVVFSFASPDGDLRQAGRSVWSSKDPVERLAAARDRLRTLPRGWEAWPLR